MDAGQNQQVRNDGVFNTGEGSQGIEHDCRVQGAVRDLELGQWVVECDQVEKEV